MQSKRDQAQAQSYLLGRLTSALVAGEPDGLETPHRRTVVGLVAGVLVAALAVGGFTLYGFFVPGGSTAWRAAGALVLEKGTGTRYVYVEGRLRPVLNYVSAKLLLGNALKVVSVSAKSLRGVPHGQPVGIIGAPDALPTAGLGGTQWSVCAPSGRDQAGNELTVLTVAVTTVPGTPVGTDHALLARAVDDDSPGYLIWNGRRFRLTESWLPKVLGYSGAAVRVPAGWLDLLPAGPDLGPVALDGRGVPGPAADGRPTRVGQLFTAALAGGADRYYLMRQDGLSRLTATEYAVLAGDPATATAYDSGVVAPVALSPAALAQLPVSERPVLPADLPASPPPAASRPDGLAWCLQSTPGGAVRLTADRPVGAAGIVRAGLGSSPTSGTADAVAIQPGLGGLVVSGRPEQAAGASYYLVTDAGLKYPLAGDAVAKTLGYQPGDAAVISPDLLDLVPSGPLLDPELVVG